MKNCTDDACPIEFEKENKTMKTTLISVPDMMCAHCEKAIRAALSQLEGVTEVAVDLGAKTVTVTHAEPLSADALLAAIAAEDFHPEILN